VVVAGTPEDVVAHARRQRAAPESAETLRRCYTGEMLDPVLSAGPRAERKPFDFQAEQARRTGDLDIHEVGRDARMPWQADGRRWHTQDRVGRNGQPCRWDGRALAEVVDRIEQSDVLSETDWNERSVVEISSSKKSQGWFFHAITAEEWLLKMKFRTSRNSFRREELVAKLDLKPLNDMPELPLYGTEPRVKCRNLRGPWQEIEVRVHTLAEIDRPAFWDFLDRAIAGFRSFTDRAREKPEDLTPWKVLGRAWHLARKGFSKGGAVRWDVALLEKLLDLLAEVAPHGQFVWNNKQVVPVFVSGRHEPWAAVQTKKRDAVYLHLTGPKGRFALGRFTNLGFEPSLDAERPEVDVLRLKFRSAEDLRRGNLRDFLREHLASLTGTS
jgi:excinuclease ABC subunit A